MALRLWRMTTTPENAGLNPDIFTQIAPPRDIKRYIRRILVANSHEEVQFDFTVRATGYCYIGWVWSGRWRGVVNGITEFDTYADGPVFVSGQILKSEVVGHIAGVPGLAFAEFQPFGQYQLLGIPGEKTLEQAVSPIALNPSLSGPLAPLLEVASGSRNEDVLEILIQALSTLSRTANSVDDRYIAAAKAIELSAGNARLKDICAAFGLRERTFRRRFHSLAGLSPKRFARLVQTNLAFGEVLQSDESISQIAASTGFSDQSHLIRALQTFHGRTPKDIRSRTEITLRRFVGSSQVDDASN